jgi:hypothetical protein
VNGQLGWADPSKPASLKTDYDRINDLLQNCQPVIASMLYEYYDASFAPGLENDIADGAVLELLIQWRNGAWVNGLTLYYDNSDLNRAIVENLAATSADLYTTPNIPDPQTTRLQYCQTHP